MKLGTQSIRSKSGIRIATVSTDRCSPDHQGEQRYCVCGSPSAVSFPHTIGNQRRPVSADRTNRDLPSTSRPRSTTGPEAWRPNWAKNGKSPTVTVVSILTGPSGPSPMARRSEASWTRTGLPPKPATTLPVSRNSAGPKPSAAATATLQSVATAPISTTPMHLTEVEALRPPGHSCSSTVRTSGPPALNFFSGICRMPANEKGRLPAVATRACPAATSISQSKRAMKSRPTMPATPTGIGSD
mmetsp:Transcript_75106/g.208884  ORF Transcript_75106/g.208884 Transcript_75106/m.208884 type:complete len:243 (+) Transcript_75106:109-837(+)